MSAMSSYQLFSFSFGHIDVEASLKDLIGAVENAALVNIPEIKTIQRRRKCVKFQNSSLCFVKMDVQGMWM